jgi:hypothetical protein
MLEVGVQSILRFPGSGARPGTPDFELATRGIDCPLKEGFTGAPC